MTETEAAITEQQWHSWVISLQDPLQMERTVCSVASR